MFITGLGTAVPDRCYTQAQCWEAMQAAARFPKLLPRSRAILRKVLSGNNGIATRHLALADLNHAFDLTPDVLHARFLDAAPDLAAQAAHRALTDARIQASDIDAVLISTCTGYLCPGLTSYVSQRMCLRPDVLALDLVGQGCGAALPNLRTAEALLASGRSRQVLSICVEVCSAAFYLDDDTGVLISACLFGDGAGAAVLSHSANGNRRVKWQAAASILQPAERDLLRFEQKDGMLRNILKPEVPLLAAAHAARVLQDALSLAGVARSQIGGWMFHPGGRDVLAALRQGLQLTDHDTRWSESVLRDHGNMSSPSVLFVLQQALAGGAPGGYWWMSAFGAGFTCHGALLEVE